MRARTFDWLKRAVAVPETLAERVLYLFLIGAGIVHFAIGITFLTEGDALVGDVFAEAAGITAPVWGWWAVLSGALILPRRTRFPALCLTAGWYALWGATLIAGVLQAGGPFYVVPVYSFLILLHCGFAAYDWFERHP